MGYGFGGSKKGPDLLTIIILLFILLPLLSGSGCGLFGTYEE